MELMTTRYVHDCYVVYGTLFPSPRLVLTRVMKDGDRHRQTTLFYRLSWKRMFTRSLVHTVLLPRLACLSLALIQVAMTLDRKSTILVTLADKSKRAATVQPPGDGGGAGGEEGNKNDPSNLGDNSEITRLPGRNFIESWPLDLSAFLGGETSISVHVGERSGGCATEDLGSTQDVSASRESLPPSSAGNQQEDQSYNGRSDAPPAPEGIRFLKLSVSLPGTKAADTVEDQDQTPALEGGGTAATAVGGEEMASARKKLLSAEAMERLNPLSIKISSAMSLPGLRIEAESLQDHMKPTNFRLLDLHCKPVYVVCRPFPDDPSGESLHPRILLTTGWAQRDLVRFEHTASFLLGPMDRHRLEDWVENSTLSVEVHDRYVCTCTQISV